MPTKKTNAFRPCKVATDQVLVSGGFNRRPEPCPFRTDMHCGDKPMFLRVESREVWLIKGACGDERISQGLSNRTTLVNESRAKLELACSGAATSHTVIRCCGDAAEPVVTDDPVAQAAGDDVVPTHTVVICPEQ